MRTIVDFNKYVNGKEEDLQVLSTICSKEKVYERVNEIFFTFPSPYRGKAQAELNFLYKQVGFMMIGNRKLKFDDFRENVKIGELNPETKSLNSKAHFAFRANGEWHYVIYETNQRFNYDKRETLRNTGLNIVRINLTEFIRRHKMELERGLYFQYITEIDNLFKEVLMKTNSQVRLLSEMKTWE